MIGKKMYKNSSDLTDYPSTAAWCNQNGAVIVDQGEYYEVVILPDDPLMDLKRELHDLQKWVDDHRDLTLDILIGVTTEEDSKDLIEEMRNKRNRIKEINDILKQGEAK